MRKKLSIIDFDIEAISRWHFKIQSLGNYSRKEIARLSASIGFEMIFLIIYRSKACFYSIYLWFMISKVEAWRWLALPNLKDICFAISQMAYGKTTENIYFNEREKKINFYFFQQKRVSPLIIIHNFCETSIKVK